MSKHKTLGPFPTYGAASYVAQQYRDQGYVANVFEMLTNWYVSIQE